MATAVGRSVVTLLPLCVLCGCVRAGFDSGRHRVVTRDAGGVSDAVADVGQGGPVADGRPADVGRDSSGGDGSLAGHGDGSLAGDGQADLGAARCSDPICDLWPPCGCEGAAKCDFVGAGRSCTPVGPRVHGETCSGPGSGECGVGTTCAGFSGWPADLFVCRQFCNEDADCSALGSGGLCRVGNVNFDLCTLSCDPIAQTGCPAQTMCSVYNFGRLGGTNCTAIGTTEEGQSCGAHFQCEPSLFCVNSQCLPICIWGQAAACPSGGTCASTGIQTLGGDTEYGACL